jgi:hypothetical protein
MHGGRWEEWWVDSGVNAYVWLFEPQYLKHENRPGGCDIWSDAPKPRRVEDYSANAAAAAGGPTTMKNEKNQMRSADADTKKETDL